MSDGSPASDETLTEDGLPASRAVQPAVGALVGRYVVVDRLGAGAMGVVFAAWDPELDRRVALKLLFESTRGTSDGRSRLVLEAQALARLAHPNVVAVHDVGTLDDRLWIAMEFVQGVTLGRWLGREQPGWQRALAALCDAGVGLAAAHAAGLVHRDFKPENVMLGDDGRVRVMDFGLARASGSSAYEPSVGTPAYMAPEQHASAPADARSDQFSFCVSLWEAIFGQRPFDGATVAELATNVLTGNLRPPPAKARVPAWLRRVIERGLSIDPEARWPSMEALLAAIASGRARERLRRPVAAALVVSLGVVGVVGARELAERRRSAACADAGAELGLAWHGAVRDGAEAAIRRSAVPDAALAATRIIAAVDRDVAQWAEARTEACLDAAVRGRWDADTLERSLWCLGEHRTKIETFIDQLDPSLETVRAALIQASDDRHIERCRDPVRLAHLPPPPDASRDAVHASRVELARITTLLSEDGFEPALALARAELAHAQEIGWPPLVAEARTAVADLLGSLGRFAEEEKELEELYFEASRAGALELARDAAIGLAYNVGYSLARPAEGMRWAREAELVLARLDEENGDEHARMLSARAAIAYRHGDLEAARRDETAALAIRERVFPADHPNLAASLSNVANVEGALGNLELQRDMLERAIAIEEMALGPGDLAVGRMLVNLGTAQRELGELDEAEALVTHGLAVQEAAQGGMHPDVANSLSHLAAVYIARDDIERARVTMERVVTITAAVSGRDHPEHATALLNLASVIEDQGKPAEARSLYQQALAILESALGTDHVAVADALQSLAALELATQRFAEAVGYAERAIAIHERGATGGDGLPRMRFVLAQALWPDGNARARALELATRARQELAADEAMTKAIDDWLAARRDVAG